MSPPTRRPKKLDKRQVADSAGRALQNGLGEPDAGNFADGVEAHLSFRKRMCPETEVGCNWGGYVERDVKSDGADSVAIGGATRVVRFPDWFIAWFDRMSPAKLDALDALATREVNRRIISKAWRGTWKVALAAVVASFAGMKWATAQVEWVIEKIPVLREVWKLLTGVQP